MLTKAAPKLLRWQRSKYSPLARQIDVFAATAKFMFFLWWDGLLQDKSAHTRRIRAHWLVNTLLDLGPTFIKIGQSLSTRADLLPLEYVKELEQLQDRVPEFSSEEAIALVESELGKDIYALYRDFDPLPIAAASLGQVHKARLHTGEDVIVKVQRPGLERLFDLDVKAVRQVMRLCDRHLPGTRKYDLESLYHEFFKILYQEIDYVQEGKNSDRFSHNFQEYPQIIVPKVYWQYTTKKVLTVEYAPGIKVDDRISLEAIGVDITKLNQLGISCYLKQLLIDGFFQADPHPGNLAVTEDGSLIFYDFGMMAEVKSLAKDEMVKTFFAVLRKDTDRVLDTLIAIGLVEPMPDMMPVRRLIAFLLDKFIDKPIDFQAFNEIKNELYIMFEQQPFRLPAQMMFIVKSLTTLDGIARTLDPHYNFLSCAQPFVKSMAVSKGRRSAIGELALQARNFIAYKLQQPSKSQVFLKRLEQRIEDGELQIRVRNSSSDRALKRINLALKTLIFACVAGFGVLTGAVLLVGGYQTGAIVAFAVSGCAGLFVLRTLLDLLVREKLDKMAEK
ncbi:MAG: AarF/ABC1/UbiB kinase family protein [Microcoleus sp. PH2017_10_PVI_O_A]|uniref:ABC1 kinase family protein n=1 Tax=unclassified Microcoleus TaxID=2642155 RepID=UPI001D693342|nr:MULTISPECIES: AarF/ABC1/UbiB kinase family protein [unclassified Microcoleus]TAE76925.1 MAG: AarF/ABC1/UbiB kinase family protein [Oscillatoriales cyanobacterium]MCC3405678.1 AarF/ABC1/UbiB kinase family protein [Microcoleus sp. PH2017_10_PVI_O_A]MCC3463398.1 AarF/ABC1/UbiB kinase family protein [Microcoleus sp. PH2017_11_PCY_U_A]MCC3478143.1 AarF/ABC1/UbiB kinase family protein [Microcoleus sp. PH2017_12_PCY_D_A]MCC3528134.1 AarF/ABC1/UbiB kinase family protein [Microcoleus sp. PH2017_21_R